jgi:transcriptional regulator with XRE-family HTH domain
MSTWALYIKTIRAAGYSFADIAAETDLTRSAVNEIDKGRTKEPRGNSAVLLRDLYHRVCKQKQRRQA